MADVRRVVGGRDARGARWRSPTLAVRRTTLALAVLAVCLPRDATAYCRTTTCTGVCEADANGCATSGTPLAWPGLCVGYSLDERGTRWLSLDEVRDAAARAFASWTGLACEGGGDSIEVVELATVTCDVVEYDDHGPNANIITFRDDDWPYTDATDALALTTVTFDMTTGAIYDADIEVNSNAGRLHATGGTAGFDLQAILTHEAGHFLGLSHSEDWSAVMAPTYSRNRRIPSADDVAGMCAAYPPGRAGVCDPTPRHGFTPACAGPAIVATGGGCRAARGPVSSGGVPLAAFALFGAVVWRRRSGARCAGEGTAPGRPP